MDLTVATANVLHAKAPWRPLADVVGWQEADKVRWTTAALKAAQEAGHALWVPGGAAAREVTISWNKDVAEEVAGGSVLTHRGLAKVSPNRWIAYVVLRLTDGSTLVVLNTHMVSGVRRAKSKRHFWRLARWYRHDVIRDALVAIALGTEVRPPTKNFGWWRDLQPTLIRFRALMEKHSPDHVVTTGDYNNVPSKTSVPGLSVVWSRHSGGIDQVHYSRGLHLVTARQLPREESDHPPFVATLSTDTQPKPPKPPEDVVTDDRYELTTYGDTVPKVTDKMTAQALDEVAHRLGYSLTVVQGAPNRGVSASAKTHWGSGVVDLAPYDWRNKVRVLREVGFAAWYRPASPSWSPHIHAVLIGNEKAHPQALDQVAAYRKGLNGLADGGPDNTPELRPKIIRPYVYKAPNRVQTYKGQLVALVADARANIPRNRTVWHKGLEAMAKILDGLPDS